MEWDFIIRLCVAGLCGTVIGLDREYRVKDAGFRTHFLVALGSALIMIVSQYGFADILMHTGVGLDPSRIAAQVVSGIGFIGAGTIIIHRQLVRGLTTAASLWATAGIGFGWGIRGAAIATVLAQIIALIWQFHILSDKSELLHFRRGIYRLRRKIVRDILAIGMSPFLMNLAACFIVILINKGLKQYGGDLMIGAYGIVNRLAFFFVMIVMGINQGMQPIAGYNFGARQYDRVLRVLRLTIIGATCVTGAGFLMGELAPRLAVSAFTNDPELIRLAVEGMRIVFVCFPIIGFQMVATNFFMSIGMAGKAIFLSLSRQLLFLMPGLIFLPHIFDVHTRWDGSWGVWCAMPLSDLMASVVAFFMLVYQLRKFRAQMDAARSTNLQ